MRWDDEMRSFLFSVQCVCRWDRHQICFTPRGSWKVSHRHHLILTITSAEWRGQLKSRAPLIQGQTSIFYCTSWHIRQRNFYRMNVSASTPPFQVCAISGIVRPIEDVSFTPYIQGDLMTSDTIISPLTTPLNCFCTTERVKKTWVQSRQHTVWWSFCLIKSCAPFIFILF